MELVELYSNLEKYFRESDHKERHPAKFRVPIGGSFYDEKEVKAVLECYLKGWLSTQIKVVEFEKIFSDYIGTSHAVAVNSGTSANILALNALMEAGDLKKGDEVIVPAATFITVASPVIQLGMVPVYVDVEKNSLNIDPKEVERAINREKTKAIMVVHTLGRPAQMDKIMEIAKKYNLKVIEDCCEAHGAAFKDKKVGTFGDLATFSFYVAHNITTGEGGALLTNSDKYHQIAAELREFGRFKSYQGERFGYSDEKLKDYDERYVFHRIGYNFRMADAPAAFGIEQVKKLDMLNEKRIQNAKFYTDNFDDELEKVFQFPSLDDSDFFQVFYAFPIVIKSDAQISRTKVVRYLESKGIETRALFCSSLPDQPCFKNAPGRTAGLLPVSRFLRDNAFFIACHPGINENDLFYVIETLKKSI